MNNTIQTLCRDLVSLLTRAVAEIDPHELLTDRQALRNLTGALRELQELCGEDTHDDTDQTPAPTPAYAVAFEGEAQQLSR